MQLDISKIKGVPPRAILQREINKRGLNQKKLAETVGEHPQTLSAILKGRRKIPLTLSLKLEKELGLEEGTLFILQVYSEIERLKVTNSEKPNLNIITRGLFWDTDVNKIDWTKHSDFIIRRTFERGNSQEKDEILRFYGSEKVEKCLSEAKRSEMKLYKNLPGNVVL